MKLRQSIKLPTVKYQTILGSPSYLCLHTEAFKLIEAQSFLVTIIASFYLQFTSLSCLPALVQRKQVALRLDAFMIVLRRLVLHMFQKLSNTMIEAKFMI